jgi:hypothetical protein
VTCEPDRLGPLSNEDVALQQLIPAELAGLSFDSVEVGSFLARLRPSRESLKKVFAVLSLTASITGTTGYTFKDVAHAHATRPNEQPCHVEITEEPNRRISEVLRRELPALPTGCVIDIDVRTPEGARLQVHIPVAETQQLHDEPEIAR